MGLKSFLCHLHYTLASGAKFRAKIGCCPGVIHCVLKSFTSWCFPMKAKVFASMVWISWQVGECEVSKSVCLIHIHPFVIRGQTGDQVACKFRLEIKFNLFRFCWCHFWHMVPITPAPASFRAIPLKTVRLTWKSLEAIKDPDLALIEAIPFRETFKTIFEICFPALKACPRSLHSFGSIVSPGT